jgi:hypothetical protein
VLGGDVLDDMKVRDGPVLRYQLCHLWGAGGLMASCQVPYGLALLAAAGTISGCLLMTADGRGHSQHQ